MVGTEAAIVSAVISGTLKIVGNKIAQLLLKEYGSIMAVKDDLQGLHGLVEEINWWLETTGDKASRNYPSFNWLKQLKDISYDVDDLVDEFHLEAEKHETNGDSGRHSVSKFLCTKTKSFMFQFKAAHRLKAIKKIFDAIVKQRTDFSAIANSVPVGCPVQHIDETTEEMPSLPNVDEASVFGRDQDKGHIISKLVEASDDRQKIKIVSIIGLGGSGKTTLAKLVFNDDNIIKNHFEVRLWVHVSQEFNVQKLIHKLFEAFSHEKSESHPLQHMTNEISEKLSRKRFLLVMDDVWTDSRIQWDDFMVHLKSGTPGSRILLTSRSSRVAETVESTDLFDLPFLSEDDSWQIFQQSLITPAKLLEFEFAEAGKRMVKKCGGVPLAIKVLAGALRDKEMVQEWHAMRDSNLLDVEGEECIVSVSACLKLSYFHLPSHLKQCFTLCSVFPKGYEIDKDQLIGLWIAHDMITPADEYSGSKCFNYLVQISFLQDVKECDSRVTCKMHDLVHDFARSILGDEISSGVPKEAASSTKNYRYFCLTEKLGNLPPEYFEKARSVYVGLEGLDFISDKTLKNAKHLRSITLESYFPGEVLAATLQGKNLKYLQIHHLYSEAALKVISNIWSLQALHILSRSLDKLPESIGKLQKLRTFDLSNCSNLESLPDSIGKLQNLRTLNLSKCSRLQSLPDSVGDCYMISSINLSGCDKLQALPNSVGKLQELRTLDFSNCDELESIPDSIGDCRMISSINLSMCRRFEALPNSVGKLQELRTLDLSWCHQKLESLPDSIGDCRMISSINLSCCFSFKVLPNSIGGNKNLRVLKLDHTKIERLPPVITTLGHLQCLDLGSSKIVELPEGIGNLEKLEILNLEDCMHVRAMPIGIGQLTQVQNLVLFVVGKGENSARMLELENIGRNSGSLTIRGISHVMDPDDARKVCLEQRTNLKRLELAWGRNDTDDVHIELEQAVLDCLEPPSGIEELYISQYAGGQFSRWMLKHVGCVKQGHPQSFQYLTKMTLSDFPKLKHLEGLVELPCLEELELRRMPSLESISGGPFPSLVKLVMYGLRSLGEVWMVTERSLAGEEDGGGGSNHSPHHLGRVHIGSRLADLTIRGCHNLMVKPYFPSSLQHLVLGWSNEQLLESPHQGQGPSSSSSCPSSFSFSHVKKLELSFMGGLWYGRGWKLLLHMTALESLMIDACFSLTKLPESMRSLASLKSLRIQGLDYLCMLPEWLGELRSLEEMTIHSCDRLSSLPQSVGHLASSLRVLRISECNALQQLPECLGELRSLRQLHIEDLPGLASLPQSMCRLTSLEALQITSCPGLTSLPEGIQGLTALRHLEICFCPDLATRCERGTGEDWHLISHIPHRDIW